MGSVRIWIILFLATAFAFSQELYVQKLTETTFQDGPFLSAKYNLKGDLLVLAGNDKVARILNAATFKEKLTIPIKTGRILSTVFGSDGATLIGASADGQVLMWNTADGSFQRSFVAHQPGSGVPALDIDAGGRLLTGGGDKETKLWDSSGKLLGAFPTAEGMLTCVKFSPNGRFVVAGSNDGILRLMDLQSFSVVRVLPDHHARITSAVYSPNGKYLATAGADSMVRVWDGETGSLLRTVRCARGTPFSLSFHSNNQWLAYADNTIGVIDVATGKIVRSLVDSAAFYCAVFSPVASTLTGITSGGAVKAFTVLAKKPDNEPPVVVFTTPAVRKNETYRIYAQEIEVAGTISDESELKLAAINGRMLPLSDRTETGKGDGKIISEKFLAREKLPSIGMNEITVSATDEAGNTASVPLRVERLSKEAAVEVVAPKEAAVETDGISINFDFKVWFDFSYYAIVLNTIEVVHKENIPRKQPGQLVSEVISLSSGYNQVQLTVVGRSGEKIQKIFNITRRVLTSTLPSTADRPGRAATGAPQRWAVVVGISEYANPAIKNLNYADRDARDFAEFLKSPAGGGFEDANMKVLLNKDATTQNVKQALYNFLRQTIDKDLVIIYFAGHGAPEPTNPNNNYLLTYDTDPNSLETTAFPMWDINTALTRYIPSKRVIVFSDACHSGGISSDVATRGMSLTETNLINQYLADLAKAKEGTIVFTASQAGEVSQELDKYGHGVFTYFLLDGMKGGADLNNDYTVTIGELMDFVEEKVKRQTNGNQHPTRNQGSYDTDITIAVIPH